mgnify:CR=1 FL=1|uniref:Sulfite oxidase n=1 Tax=Schlesneria paludicola TaxID=360056 RepID=A0A7C4QSC1_9PLAN
MTLWPAEFRVDRRSWLMHTALAATALAGGVPRPLWGEAGTRKRLITRQESPFNGEPPLDQLAHAWLTPWELFFVRSHGAIPQLDPQTYRLEIQGLVERPGSFSLAELRDRFRFTTVFATLTCAGNRRDEFSAEQPIAGLQWNAGAIGHAQWGGIRLADVLRAAGLKPEAQYVWFEGADEIDDPLRHASAPFGGSLSLEKALADTPATPGALLAWQMQQQPLTSEHGAPLRLVVPGYIGARSVKWLQRIVVSAQPSPNRFVARDYKLLYSGTDEEISSTGPILEYLLNSAIAFPVPGARLQGDRVLARGYALAGGQPGCQIAQVEVSSDGGQSWRTAQLTSPRREFSWVTWSSTLPLTPGPNTLLVRATDSTGQTQPEHARWNVKGYQNNGWHRITVIREA